MEVCPLVPEIKYLFFANCGAKSSFSLVFAQGEMSHFRDPCAGHFGNMKLIDGEYLR